MYTLRVPVCERVFVRQGVLLSVMIILTVLIVMLMAFLLIMVKSSSPGLVYTGAHIHIGTETQLRVHGHTGWQRS